MEHDGEARQAVGDLLQDIEPELGLLAGLEFISAVAGADRDGQESTPVRSTKSCT